MRWFDRALRWARPAGRWTLRAAVWVGIPVGLGQVLASPVFIFGLFGRSAPHKIDPGLWAYGLSYYLWNYPSDVRVQHLAVAWGPTTMAVLGIMMWAKVSRMRNQGLQADYRGTGRGLEPMRAKSRLHGRSRWLESHEAAKLYPPAPPDEGGIPIVELHRVDLDSSIRGVSFDPADPSTWGRGGKAKMVIDPLSPGKIASGVIISGSGGGKTTGFSIPAMHSHRGSIVMNDPSGSVSHITSAWREEIGHKVAIIDPEFPALGAMNILKTIDLNSKMAPMLIKAFVTEASGPSKQGFTREENFFKREGISLNTALLADLLFDPNAEHTVREWRKRIVIPEREMRTRLASIHAHSRSDYARDVAGEMMHTVSETFSGIRKHATGDTEWLSIRAFSDLLSEDTFDPAELIKGRMTVYMQFPSILLNADPSIARVVLGSLMRCVMMAKGRVHSAIPFIIDEAYQLKHMDTLATARDEGRYYRMPIYTMWQSSGQISEVWTPEGKKAWFNSAAWRMYIGGVDDPETGKELSDVCGTYTVLAPTEGTTRSAQGGATGSRVTNGSSTGTTLQPRNLVQPHELRTEIRGDEAIVLWRNQYPARFSLPACYRRPEMVADLNLAPAA